MDILSVTFTESGNEACVRTDQGFFDITRADLSEFLREFFGEDVKDALAPGCENDFFPLYAKDEAASSLEFLSQKLKAIKYAVYLLGINDKSEKQLLQKLKTKGYPKPVCNAAFAVLKKNGYLCDERSCKRKCELLANGKLFGERRIITELLAKGYSYELCHRVVDEADIDFEENLSALFEKISGHKYLSDREQKKKIYDKLLRYGYSYDEVRDLFERLLADEY